MLDLPLGNVSAYGDDDVDGNECGRRGVLPVLFLARPPPSRPLLSVCLLELVPRPRAWEARAVRTICGGGRAVLLACVLIPSCRSLARRSFAIVAVSGFPSTGSYDDHALDRFRLSLAGVAWCFLMRIVCGEQMGTARLSDVAPYAFPSCLVPFPRGNPVIRSRSCFPLPVPLRLLA